MFNKKKFTCIKQQDLKDCGPACLSTIAKHYKLNISISKIREMCETDLYGTNIKGILKAADKLGFTSKAIKAKKLESLLEIPLPAIAHITKNNILHYVVIHQINNKEIIIADPAEGLITYKIEEFYQIWSGILVLLIPSNSFKKGKQEKSILESFIEVLKPQKKILFIIFIVSILFNILNLMSTFYFKILIDDLIPNNLIDSLYLISIGIIILYILKILLAYLRTYLILKLNNKIDSTLMLKYYKHVINLPMNFFNTRKTGEIISRFSDSSKIRDAISTTFITLTLDTIMVIIGSVVLFKQNHILYYTTISLIPFYILTIMMFHKTFEIINRKEMESNSDLTSYIIESVKGIPIIKSYNAENQVFEQMQKRFNTLLNHTFSKGKSINLQDSFKTAIELIGGTIILLIGANQVLKGHMTIGELITYNALLIYFLNPVKNLVQLQPKIQSAIVATKRLNAIFELELEQNEKEQSTYKKINKLSGNISINNLNFSYGTRKKVLKDINFFVSSGTQIAFVGESGSGKTTIVNLLLKYYPIQEGNIYYDKIDIKNIDHKLLRERIAYVPQEPFFFNASIYENLTVGINKNISLKEIEEVAKQTFSHEFIQEMPLKYETILDENGSNLSGGQKQRLEITKALLKKPDILILDEVTSNLDSITEKAITEMLKTLNKKGITIIIIAHRLSTTQHADKIFVMKKGEIIEEGTHNQLISQKNEYFKLWKNQNIDIKNNKTNKNIHYHIEVPSTK